MKSRSLLVSLLAGLLLSGCATFNETELGLIQNSGVSPRIVTKMEHGRVLTPEDVIELTRRKVPESYLLRQIDDIGVDYVLSPEDFKKLQQARVRPAVIDALVMASDDFASGYAYPRYDLYSVDPFLYPNPYRYSYPYYDSYYGPRRQPRLSGAVGIGFSSGGPRHWRRR